MDFQTAFNLAIAVAGVLAMVILKQTFSAIKDARDAGTAAAADASRRAEEAQILAKDAHAAVNAHRLHVAENYIGVKRFEGFVSPMW